VVTTHEPPAIKIAEGRAPTSLHLEPSDCRPGYVFTNIFTGCGMP